METSLYSNTVYSFEREGSKTIIINIPMTVNDNSFRVNLDELITIDEHSDIYLDSLTTYDCNTSNGSPNNIGFILSIDEFEIRSVSNTSTIGRSLFIPNDQNHATITTVSKTHKGKKMNYVCSINPMKLQQITGKITNIAGGTAFASDNGRFIAEFVIISKEN